MKVYKPKCADMGMKAGMIREARVMAKVKKGGMFMWAMGDDIYVKGASDHSRQAHELS